MLCHVVNNIMEGLACDHGLLHVELEVLEALELGDRLRELDHGVIGHELGLTEAQEEELDLWEVLERLAKLGDASVFELGLVDDQ